MQKVLPNQHIKWWLDNRAMIRVKEDVNLFKEIVGSYTQEMLHYYTLERVKFWKTAVYKTYLDMSDDDRKMCGLA